MESVLNIEVRRRWIQNIRQLRIKKLIIATMVNILDRRGDAEGLVKTSVQ